jgi:DNA repair protein RadD
MTLRPYQSRAVADVLASLGDNPILVSPTGSGKTVMAKEMVRCLADDYRILWLAHRKELIEQAADHLQGMATIGIIRAGVTPAPAAKIQIASKDTLIRREVPRTGVVIVDEVHHCVSASCRDILDRLPGAYRIGLTATPFRMDGRGLGETLANGQPMFGKIIVAAYTDELVAAGYLHAPKVYAGKAPDLRGVKIKHGDYEIGALADRYGDDENADIVREWMKRCEIPCPACNGTGQQWIDDATDYAGAVAEVMGTAPVCPACHGARKHRMKTVAFAVNVEHSKRIAAAFCEAGVPAEHLDGKATDAQRDAALHRLASGQTQVLSNCNLFLEGWDMPSLECAIIARPTASLAVHIQSIGRVMRVCDGKRQALVLDHAGNHHVHGLITRRLEYSLDGRIVGQSEPLGLKRCPDCFLMVEVDKRSCPECDHTFVPGARDCPTITGDASLQEYVSDFAYRREFWSLIEAQRQAWNYKPGWSAFRFKERFGEWPVVVGGELVDPDNAQQDQKRTIFEGLLRKARNNRWKDGWASHQFKERFGVWPSGFVTEVRVLLDSEGLLAAGSEEDARRFNERWTARGRI